MLYFIIYLVVINIIAFALFGIDKTNAIRHKRRISEYVLFAVSLIGGSVGAALGMIFFHHKTRKIAFKIGMPLIILAQFALPLLIVSVS